MKKKQKGPVMQRREQVEEGTTTDQRLLDSRGPSDWVHTDPWRVMRIQAEFIEGFGALAELGPAIGVFGSARTRPGDPMLAHKQEEFVPTMQIVRCESVLRTWLGSDGGGAA